MEDSLLRIENLTAQYEINHVIVAAVTDLSLSIGRGECVGLVGETGAGKSTTALSVMGLLPNPPGRIVSGSISFMGQNLLAMKPKELRKVRGNAISMIFQDPMTSLNPVMRIGDQIMEVILLHEKISRAEATRKAQEMLELVGIPARRYSDYPHQFSGGMKQRVMIACALACNPQLLIADEPTTALDVTIQAQVLDLIGNLKQKFNTAMLMITHDLGVVAEVCDKVAVMYAGRIVEYGKVTEVYAHTLHPYTKGLFQSLPRLDEDTDRLEPISGMMPDPTNLPKGCAFAPRCPYATAECGENQPEYKEWRPGHFAACIHVGEEAKKV